MHTNQPTQPNTDWDPYRPTDGQETWISEHHDPPEEVADTEWERWQRVHESVKAGTAMYLPVDLVRRLQARLRPDHKPESVWGEFDPHTVIGLFWFQRDHDLTLTGIPDRETLRALFARDPQLAPPRRRRAAKARLLVPDGAYPDERYAYYRSLVLNAGGLVDEQHLDINIVVLKGAELRQGREGIRLYALPGDSPQVDHSYVTVTFGIERASTSASGEIVGIRVTERPGDVALRRLPGRGLSTGWHGQFIAEFGYPGRPIPEASCFLPRHARGPDDLGAQPPSIPLAPRVNAGQVRGTVDISELTRSSFVSELSETRQLRKREAGWTGLRVTRLHASRLDGPFR